MKILTRYILGEFIAFLAWCIVAFVAVFVLVDAVQIFDTFIDRRVRLDLVLLYYVFYTPYILVLTVPIAMLLTTMFSIGRLVGDNEIIAMRASGVSLYRILFPLYVFAFIVGLFVMGFSEYVVPQANQFRQDIETQGNDFKFTFSRSRELDQAYVFVANSDSSIIYSRHYSSENQIARLVSYIELANSVTVAPGAEESLGITRRIDAEYMYFEDGHWIMVNAMERRFTPEGEILTQHETLPSAFISARPSDFARIDMQPEEMNYLQLRSYIGSIRERGGDANSLLVDLYLKIAFPFASFIIVFFGAPLALGAGKRGKASAFGIALLICFAYYTMINGSQILGRNGSLDPALSAWFPNAFFFFLGVLLHLNANR